MDDAGRVARDQVVGGERELDGTLRRVDPVAAAHGQLAGTLPPDLVDRERRRRRQRRLEVERSTALRGIEGAKVKEQAGNVDRGKPGRPVAQPVDDAPVVSQKEQRVPVAYGRHVALHRAEDGSAGSATPAVGRVDHDAKARHRRRPRAPVEGHGLATQGTNEQERPPR